MLDKRKLDKKQVLSQTDHQGHYSIFKGGKKKVASNVLKLPIHPKFLPYVSKNIKEKNKSQQILQVQDNMLHRDINPTM